MKAIHIEQAMALLQAEEQAHGEHRHEYGALVRAAARAPLNRGGWLLLLAYLLELSALPSTSGGTPPPKPSETPATKEQPPVYIPGPGPLVNETPEARRARHLRRRRQVAAGNAEAPLEIPARPRADLGVEAPQPGASE